jgi:hypothetical protein
MLFHVSQKPKAGFTHEDQKLSLAMWTNWEPPTGLEIKMHVFGPDGTVYVLVEAETAEAVYEAPAPWSAVVFDFEIKPVVEVAAAIAIQEKTIAFRESVRQ